MSKIGLTENDFNQVALELKCEPAAIKAVSEVESKGNGFMIWQGKEVPVILFERHKFHKYTNGKYDLQRPDISNKKAGGYGSISIQHNKLSDAVALDREAALKSASYGKFQIMGFNYKQAGYNDLQTFINAMWNSERDHLIAFSNFIKNDPALLKAIRAKDWVTFAKYYNGKDYKENNYDVKLKIAYGKFCN